MRRNAHNLFRILVVISIVGLGSCDTPVSPDPGDTGDTGDAPPSLFTVTFDSNGGSSVDPITSVAAGSKITAPADPTRDGMSFAGWYADPGLTSVWDFDVNTVTADLTLYASWTALATYTVTFDSQGATVDASPSSKTVTEPETTIDALPSPPAKDGLIFAGWFTETNGGGTEFTTSTPVTSHTTVHANWTPYQVGDEGPAGGIVFYDKGSFTDGWRYLEAASVDIGSASWAPAGSGAVAAARSKEVGSGTANTAAIVAAVSSTSIAAYLCDAYSITNGGVTFDDWFLPSHDEMILAASSGVLGLNGRYWTSTEFITTKAYAVYHTDDFAGNFDKFQVQNVRPVRTF